MKKRNKLHYTMCDVRAHRHMFVCLGLRVLESASPLHMLLFFLFIADVMNVTATDGWADGACEQVMKKNITNHTLFAYQTIMIIFAICPGTIMLCVCVCRWHELSFFV